MDKNQLVSKLNKVLPGSVLETRRFGRSNVSSIWVEANSIDKIARALIDLTGCQFDWLENLSVVELEGVLVVSYFVRSILTQQCLVVRASTVPSAEGASVEIPSIRAVWPMGEPMEKEATEMFGVIFKDTSPLASDKGGVNSKLLPDRWKGYPMRKSYVFPTEYYGISHSRPATRPRQKNSTS